MHNKNSILLVDDNPVNLKQLVKNLTHQDYELLTTTSGASALQLAQAAKPDLILLDIMMPELSGLDVCKKLKADEATQEIPVIFLSSRNEVEDKVKAFKAGGVDYITRPFQREELLVRVETHLKISRLTHQLSDALAKQKQLNDHLLELSMRDPLTNLYNRRFFFERIEAEMKRAKRQNAAIAITIIDIDAFKEVNDTYGHLCGDFVLKEMSAFLRRNIRETDLLARYGGEEFIIAFFDIQPDGMYRRLESLRETIASQIFVYNRVQIQRTVSIGLSICQFEMGPQRKIEQYINEADRALYHAKKTGKNQIVRFSDLAES
jgi:diguanylate cyclase (GGDEF)-like protein